jgi:hypothetical protein
VLAKCNEYRQYYLKGGNGEALYETVRTVKAHGFELAQPAPGDGGGSQAQAG